MISKIITACDMPNYEIIKANNFSVGVYTQKSPERIDANEDSLGIFKKDNAFILCVADGVGGSPKGQEASSIAIQNILSAAEKNSEDIRNAILDGIEQTNKNLLQAALGSQTTLTVCEISKKRLRSYQVGDSSLFVCGRRGRLKHKTLEHSPVGYGVEAGLIAEKKALKHPERHYVFNVLGDREMKIEMCPYVKLASNDTILIASDGLFDNFLIENLIEIVRKGSLEEVMTTLTQQCQALKKSSTAKSDDLSFMICRQN